MLNTGGLTSRFDLHTHVVLFIQYSYISLTDVVFHEDPKQTRKAVGNGLYDENLCSGSLTSPHIIGEALEEAETFFGDVGDTKNLVKRPRKTPTNLEKLHWSTAEEIQLRLKKHFDAT